MEPVPITLSIEPAAPEIREMRPQVGSQEAFLATEADIAVYGGAAGAGKSYALLMEPLRYISNKQFTPVIFRRTYPQITNPDGLWDTSTKIYPYCGAIAKESTLEWTFPSGCRLKFGHMQHEKDRYNWDGAQIAMLGFDQLEHFTWKQFFYMLARNRSTSGVPPYIRATCNPDPDHWLRDFMAWWIDDESGLPIPSRSGTVRYFAIINEETLWADSEEELVDRFGEQTMPKSFTFIPGNVYDNRILLDENPEYLANLKALAKVDRERLMLGNWNSRETAGAFFQRVWCEIVEAAPTQVREIRYWDRAATAPQPGQAEARASWTVGLKMGRDQRGTTYILDVSRFQGSPGKVTDMVTNVASQDAKRVQVGLEQDPGQAGVAEARALAAELAGYVVILNPVRESKGSRFRPFSAQAEAGNVKIVRGPWNEAFFRELEQFDASDKCASDQVDAASGAFYLLTQTKRAGTWGRK